MKKKIGILTGGGDCPGLNAVIRAVTKASIHDDDSTIIGFLDGYKGLVENNFIKLESHNVSGILDKGGTILGTTNNYNPYMKNGEKIEEEKIEEVTNTIISNLAMHGIDCLIIIGGEGTLTTAYEMSKRGINIIGVPKTIDNDIEGTDITFGFSTAVETATEAIDKLHSTAESQHRVMILEVMGRNAGWIAVVSGIAGGADVILIPEIPYNINSVARKVFSRKNAGKGFSIIVVAEGAKPNGGEQITSDIYDGRPEPKRLGGIGRRLAIDLEGITNIETRVTSLGYLQRGGSPIAYDRLLSTRLGVAAADLAHQEKYGKMVCIKGSEIDAVDLEVVAYNVRLVPAQGEFVKIAESIGVSFGNENKI